MSFSRGVAAFASWCEQLCCVTGDVELGAGGCEQAIERKKCLINTLELLLNDILPTLHITIKCCKENRLLFFVCYILHNMWLHSLFLMCVMCVNFDFLKISEQTGWKSIPVKFKINFFHHEKLLWVYHIIITLGFLLLMLLKYVNWFLLFVSCVPNLIRNWKSFEVNFYLFACGQK